MTSHVPTRILVIEDEMLVALLIVDMVTELGFEVVGPAMRLETGLAMARQEKFDLAILDVNLASQKSDAIADALKLRGIPFIFATGYGAQGLNEAHQGIRTLQKPFNAQELARAIGAVLPAG